MFKILAFMAYELMRFLQADEADCKAKGITEKVGIRYKDEAAKKECEEVSPVFQVMVCLCVSCVC